MMGDATGAQWRVLVVDDEDNLNWSLVTSLRKEGYAVEGALTGEDAQRRLGMARFDCVVSDVKMPGMDGFQLLEWLREHQPGTRVIMMTAFGSPTVRQEALRGGVVAYFEKPFDLRALKEELRRMAASVPAAASAASTAEGYDLLDVAQVLGLTRRDIVLAVRNAGRTGTLRFAGGELLWAETETLRGDEAFIALCAPRSGWAQPLPWSGSLERNVSQSLSRLIYLALAQREGRATAGPLNVAYAAAPGQANASQAPSGDTSAGASPLDQSAPDDAATAEVASVATPMLPQQAGDLPAPAPPIEAAAPRPTESATGRKPAVAADVAAALADVAAQLPQPCGLLWLGGDGAVLWQHRGDLVEVAPAAYSHLQAAVQAAMRAALLADMGTVEHVRVQTTAYTLALCRPPHAERNAALLIVLPTGPESREEADAALELVRQRFGGPSSG
jgi:DNA-binding response OmpR family regulator